MRAAATRPATVWGPPQFWEIGLRQDNSASIGRMSNRVERNPSLAIVGEVADEPGGWLIRRRIEGLPPGLPPDRVTSAVLLVHQRMVVGADMKDTFASVLLAGVTLDLGLRMPKPAGIHAVEDQVHLAGCGAAGLRPMRSLTYRPPLQR